MVTGIDGNFILNLAHCSAQVILTNQSAHI